MPTFTDPDRARDAQRRSAARRRARVILDRIAAGPLHDDDRARIMLAALDAPSIPASHRRAS